MSGIEPKVVGAKQDNSSIGLFFSTKPTQNVTFYKRSLKILYT